MVTMSIDVFFAILSVLLDVSYVTIFSVGAATFEWEGRGHTFGGRGYF